jgi:hypothetical protein
MFTPTVMFTVISIACFCQMLKKGSGGTCIDQEILGPMGGWEMGWALSSGVGGTVGVTAVALGTQESGEIQIAVMVC